MSNDKKQLSASERLKGLEASVNLLDQTIGNVTQSLVMTNQKVSDLDDIVEAMVRLSERGQPISKEAINSIRVEINVERLEARLSVLVEQGILAPTESITAESFVVGRETNKDTGEVKNPRMQFAVGVMNEKAVGMLLGKKAGDQVQLEESNPVVLEIERIYGISTPKLPEVEAVQDDQAKSAEEASATTEEAQA